MENSIEEDIKILEEFKKNGYSILLMKYGDRIKTNFKLTKAIEHILLDYKRVLKENETYKKQYFGLIYKIENKIDKFDYEFEKAKRKNYRERADYYWDLIINLKKLLESEE